MRYCKTIDKNGRTVYWQISNDGKRKRVAQKVGKSKGSPPDCKKASQSKASPKKTDPKKPKSSFTGKSVAELKELANKKGVYPKQGSGKGGRVVKQDLINALSGKAPKQVPKTNKVDITKLKEKYSANRSSQKVRNEYNDGNLYYSYKNTLYSVNTLVDNLRKYKIPQRKKIVYFSFVEKKDGKPIFLVILKLGNLFEIKKLIVEDPTNIQVKPVIKNEDWVDAKIMKLIKKGAWKYSKPESLIKNMFTFAMSFTIKKRLLGISDDVFFIYIQSDGTDLDSKLDLTVMENFFNFIGYWANDANKYVPKWFKKEYPGSTWSEFHFYFINGFYKKQHKQQSSSFKHAHESNCEEIMKKYNIKSRAEFRKWMIKRHPDKLTALPENERKVLEEEFKLYKDTIQDCVKKGIFAK
jgi:hypothetical protein